jgi:hypothetical protein
VNCVQLPQKLAGQVQCVRWELLSYVFVDARLLTRREWRDSEAVREAEFNLFEDLIYLRVGSGAVYDGAWNVRVGEDTGLSLVAVELEGSYGCT